MLRATGPSVLSLCVLMITALPRPLLALGPQFVPPLLTQFDERHGIVIGTLERTKPVPHKDDPSVILAELYFKVDEVIAPATSDPAWPLKAGDSFMVLGSIGSWGVIESWYNQNSELEGGDSPPAGAKFLLSVRRNAERSGYEHAEGAGAARPLLKLSDADRQHIAGIRELALLTGDRRVARCRELTLAANARAPIRLEAIRHLKERCFHAYLPRDEAEKAARESERKETAATFRRAWNDPALRQTLDLFTALDHGLWAADWQRFRGSDERRQVWLEFVFRPVQLGTPAEVEAELRKRPLSRLWELAEPNPAPVADVLVKQLAEEHWPIEFRMQIADSLASVDDRAKSPDPMWEKSWRSFMAEVLPTADGWQSRQLLSSIEWRLGAAERQKPQRPIGATADLVELLKAKRESLMLKAAAEGLDRQSRDIHYEYRMALQKCAALIEWVEEPGDRRK